MLPKECQPAPAKLPEACADASTERPPEFPNDCHLPAALREFSAPDGVDRKLREPEDEPKPLLPELKLRAKLLEERLEEGAENPPDFAEKPPFERPLLLKL